MSYKEAIPKNAILRRVTGLKTIQFKSKPSKYNISADEYNRKDRNVDGEFESDFSQNVIPGAVTQLAPYWNDLKDTYWVEDPRILKEIVESGPIRLRYPDNHDRSGQLIKSEDIDPKNFWDPFFQHVDLQKQRMESGKYLFECQKNPIDALLFYSYKNDPRVLVRDGREISKFVVGKAQYELIIPKHETMDNKAQLKKEMDSMVLLSKMSFERQKHIARLLNLRVNDFDNPDPDELVVEMGNAAKDRDRSSRWGIPMQDKFLEFGSMSNEDLMLHVDIRKGIDSRVITQSRNEFSLNSEKLEGVSDETDLFNYFSDGKNSEKYKDLIFLLQEKEKAVG